jgi:hypothetical protein
MYSVIVLAVAAATITARAAGGKITSDRAGVTQDLGLVRIHSPMTPARFRSGEAETLNYLNVGMAEQEARADHARALKRYRLS